MCEREGGRERGLREGGEVGERERQRYKRGREICERGKEVYDAIRGVREEEIDVCERGSVREGGI